MRLDTKVFITATMLLLMLLIWSISLEYRKGENTDRCNFLGGVYIEGQCFKAELIELK